MVEEERYCADVLMQLSSVQEALRGVGRGLLLNHLKYCVTDATRSQDPEQADAMYEELMELMYKNAR
jgi:DNA-binding FrmR family transcriptional regulator